MPHFEECYYLFGVPLWPSAPDCPWGCLNIQWYPWIEWDEEDIQMSFTIMEAWTNFVKFGYVFAFFFCYERKGNHNLLKVRNNKKYIVVI